MKIHFNVLLMVAATELILLYCLNNAYIEPVLKESAFITIDESFVSQNKKQDARTSMARPGSINTAINIDASALDNDLWNYQDVQIRENYLLRHSYNHQKRAEKPTSDVVGDEDKQRIVLFVHFHKAGGSSMVDKFRLGGYQFWNYENNGNPRGLLQSPPKPKTTQQNFSDYFNNTESGQICSHDTSKRNTTNLQFWRYSRPQFEAFLRDGKGQKTWPFCLPSRTTANIKGGVEFLGLEFSFFRKDHFFETGYLREQANIDVITILRDPYDRFLSNFYYMHDNPELSYVDPMEWARLDKVQQGEIVIFNKPNYYTAFLNGLAGNTDENNVDDDSEASSNFNYFAFGLNRTHLEVAKQRLTRLFDAIVILERPETYQQLDRWFQFLDETRAERQYPHQNKNSNEVRYPRVNLTRTEFHRYNELDKELYEYALELSLLKSAKNQKIEIDTM